MLDESSGSRSRRGLSAYFTGLTLLALSLAFAGGLFSGQFQSAEAASPCAVTGHLLDDCFDLDPGPTFTGGVDVNGTDDTDGWDDYQVVASNNANAWVESDNPTSGGDCRIRREELQIRDHCVVTYGPINVEGYTDLDLSYLYGIVRQASSVQSAIVQYSTDGTNFTTLETYTFPDSNVTSCSFTIDTDCADTAASFDLTVDSCATPDLYIRFAAQGPSTSNDNRFVVDDVAVTGTAGTCGIPLTVEKDCYGYDSGDIFTFTLAGTSGISGPITPEEQTIACGETAEFSLPIQGNYTVVETVPSNWSLTPLAGPNFTAGSCETTTGTQNVRFHYPLYGEGGSAGQPNPSGVANGVRLEVPAAGAINGQEVTCVFENAPPMIPLTVTKDCGDYDGPPAEFTFSLTAGLPGGVDPVVYDDETIGCGESAEFELWPQGNYQLVETVPFGWELTPLSGPNFSAGSCETTTGNPNVRFHYPLYGEGGDAGQPNPSGIENGVRLEVPAIGAVDGQEVTCTFENVAPDEFLKWTYSETYGTRDEFKWFVQVPAQEENWVLWDFLPGGIRLDGYIHEPDGVDCEVFRTGVIRCSGGPTESVVIKIPVKTTTMCGDFYNHAKLLVEGSDPAYASDGVSVENCDTGRARSARGNR